MKLHDLIDGRWRSAGRLRSLAAVVLLAALGACGGGGGGGSTGAEVPSEVKVDLPASRAEAVRFLNQASFGATAAEADRVTAIGYTAWIDEQLARPQTLHRASWDAEDAALKAVNKDSRAGSREVLDSFYRQALTGSDPLRQRVAFALSQIFVISLADGTIADNAQGAAGYLDMLGANAFGSYRNLIEGVARHPMMGIYLSHLKNMKEDPARGRVPDENFAREVMQLFSIGLVQLNVDGSVKAGPDGKPLETYTGADIAGLAKVFTGWSWDGPDTADGRYYGWGTEFIDPARLYSPMQGYTQFHSLSEKKFLGATVPAQARADPNASLKVALDTLAAHPNVGPFIGRQLIQRLVTSNPSPAYVSRVALAFTAGGGDMKAMVKAVLLDPEARDATIASGPAYGKLREPVLRLTAFLRAFGATSDSGKFLIGTTDDAGTQLGQSPLRSPSVFNFYRPGYVPPNTLAGMAGLAAPEMQITHETTVAGYANFMRSGVQNGFGQNGTDYKAARRDVQIDYTGEIALADTSAALVDRVLERLLGPAPRDALKAEIVAAVDSIVIPVLKADGSNQTAIDNARKNRVYTAVVLTLVAPEFLVQK